MNRFHAAVSELVASMDDGPTVQEVHRRGQRRQRRRILTRVVVVCVAAAAAVGVAASYGHSSAEPQIAVSPTTSSTTSPLPSTTSPLPSTTSPLPGTGSMPVMTVHDSVGDVPYPQGDITDAGFSQDATNFSFGVTVVQPLDPATDPAWHNGNAVLGFSLDANNDGVEDWYALALPQGPNQAAKVGLRSWANPHVPTCWGTLASIPGAGYRLTFPNRCLPGGMRFRLHAQMDFNPKVGTYKTATDQVPGVNAWSAPFTTLADPLTT